MSIASIIIDAVLALIVLFLVFKGYRRGLIVEMIGVVAIIAAIVGANILAGTYASEFADVMKPFAGGLVDKAVSGTVSEDENHDGVLSPDEMSDVYTVTYNALRKVGVSEPSARLIAEKLNEQTGTAAGHISERITDYLCEKLTFLLIFAIVFILIVIIFVAIGNVINLAFKLPGLETLNHVAGAVFGFAKGAIIVLFIACLFRYLGLLVPEEITDKTILLKWLTNSNILADIIGI